jgi:hypothetical protein
MRLWERQEEPKSITLMPDRCFVLFVGCWGVGGRKDQNQQSIDPFSVDPI